MSRKKRSGTGEWLALTPEATGMTQAEIHIFTRQAGSKVGATTMDRPEWVAVNPVAMQAYCALTNNKNRAVKPNAGGDETPAIAIKKHRVIEPAKLAHSGYLETAEDVERFLDDLRRALEAAIANNERIQIR